ncbi:WD40 repeat-like protein, partial [Aureobasidium pullulans]
RELYLCSFPGRVLTAHLQPSQIRLILREFTSKIMSDPALYTVGWICALTTECTAARQFLDEEHNRPSHVSANDTNDYTLGKIADHNVVIAVLPDGEYGLSSAAGVAKDMLNSFRNIRVGLMVGIGGGAPTAKDDVRLGDVVVSSQKNGTAGVYQYDYGKTIQGQSFQQTGFLNQPPTVVRAAVSGLRSKYEDDGHQIRESIEAVLDKKPRLRKKYSRPGPESDRLYRAKIVHPDGDQGDCDRVCGTQQADLVHRRDREEDEDNPAIHYGVIASANQLMKDATIRDTLAKDKGVLCFEMEAAGIMNRLPCLVIRGICDYSDSHKNKEWQGYAAMAAAAYARELLTRMVPSRVEGEAKLEEIIDFMSQEVDVLKDKIDLAKLEEFAVKGAVHDSYEDEGSSTCLVGTRTELLRQIARWADDPNGKCIFWLCGKAGTGKSTISRTFAVTLNRQDRLGASFFFKRNVGDRVNAGRVFPTLAIQLADNVPYLSRLIAITLDKDSVLCGRSLMQQFEKLLLEPLTKATCNQNSVTDVIIVLDALDECDSESDIKSILKLLARLQSIGTVRLRVLVTSRPELPVKLGFHTLDVHLHHDIELEVAQAPTIEHDIHTYLCQKFKEITLERSLRRPNDALPLDWPGEANIRNLVGLAVPLFIFAVTVCRFISDRDPERRLKAILEHRRNMSYPGLVNMYLPVLEQLVLGQDGRDSEAAIREFREIVGPIVLIADPLSVLSLSKLLEIEPSDIDDRLERLHSVLHIPTDQLSPVQLLHLSFPDFLVDPQQEDKNQFWIDEVKMHIVLTKQCLRLLNLAGTLEEDICKVKKPGTRRADIAKKQVFSSIPADVNYACCYWVWHLEKGGARISDNDPVHKFLGTHFLHWMEALSWLGKLSSLGQHLSTLLSLVCPDRGADVTSFLGDARRFVLRNRYVVDLAPLQLYLSALIFTPESSIVKRVFEQVHENNSTRWLSLPLKVPAKWSLEEQKLEGHDSSVHSVAFSRDGQLVASGS